MIELNDVTLKIKKRTILDNLSLRIDDNDSIGLVGANGSGKSTLIDILSGNIKPTSGHVSISTETIFGIQYQTGHWPSGTKIIDVIEALIGKNVLNNNNLKDLINYFEIYKIFQKSINSLSGGQKQKFNCFLAIANNSNFVIFDELITGLDLKTQNKFMNYLINHKKDNKKTFLIVSHVPEEIEYLTDKFFILDKGRIVGLYKNEEIIKKYKSIRLFLENYFMSKEGNTQNEN